MGKFITELKVALINWMNVGSNRLIYDSFIDMFKKYSGLFELTNEQHFDGDEVNQRFPVLWSCSARAAEWGCLKKLKYRGTGLSGRTFN